MAKNQRPPHHPSQSETEYSQEMLQGSSQQASRRPSQAKWWQKLLPEKLKKAKSRSQASGRKTGASARDSGHAAGGFVGLVGLIGLGLIAGLLFITENFFFSMLIFSIGLLLYTTGTEIVRIVIALMTAFFSTRHLTEDASMIGETALLLKEALVSDTTQGRGHSQKSSDDTVVLLSNPLTEDLRKAVQSGQRDRLEYVAHRYYFDCHELYEFSRLNLQFASEAMPYVGLVGTVLGLIMMFDGLGASVNVEALTPQLAIALKTTLYGAFFGATYKVLAARFDQRLQKLEYDYDDLLRSLDLIAKTDINIEVQS